MSENTQNNSHETSERTLSGIKSKWKTILPIVVIGVIILVVIFKLIGTIFGGGGYSITQKAIKALQEQEPKKVLSYVPEDLTKEVMDYYDLNKDELNEAIEKASMFTIYNEVTKSEITKIKITNKIKITPKVMKKQKDTASIQLMKNQLSVIDKVWNTDDLKKICMATLDIKTKKEDGKKEKNQVNAFSIKYKGKWYSIDCMCFLVAAAEQHVQRQIDIEKYPEFFN